MDTGTDQHHILLSHSQTAQDSVRLLCHRVIRQSSFLHQTVCKISMDHLQESITFSLTHFFHSFISYQMFDSGTFVTYLTSIVIVNNRVMLGNVKNKKASIDISELMHIITIYRWTVQTQFEKQVAGVIVRCKYNIRLRRPSMLAD